MGVYMCVREGEREEEREKEREEKEIVSDHGEDENLCMRVRA